MCEGRVVIVTGAGRGIGRAHALEFARQGAKVVVNDLGAEVDGTGSSPAAELVVDEIKAMGGTAISNGENVADWEGAQRVINAAIETFGTLDVVVNNAGILRDRMIVNMTDAEWDAVITVHLKSTFSMTRWAATYWREKVKAGETVDARIINTSSSSGIYGNVGQANYGAAKAGIAAFTIIASQELGRYGVNVNAIAPVALTRMTENLGIFHEPEDPAAFNPVAPENISPLVVWLGSSHSKAVTGRVFDVVGGHVDVAEGWHAGPAIDKGDRWTVEELNELIPDLVAKAAKNADQTGRIPN
jgi:NAD(P)-dependent dehydrogenase (short-subunit alcohol dehydrogenase family)